jgi:hypothetical protein
MPPQAGSIQEGEAIMIQRICDMCEMKIQEPYYALYWFMGTPPPVDLRKKKVEGAVDLCPRCFQSVDRFINERKESAE